ncbi:MAG: zinc ABC transporter substrate-binding protein, partial [Nanoarchaeota archaeon]|nr:zinc ABC transporter substrate-binding protein [Nanoarchaeota archaeon]
MNKYFILLLSALILFAGCSEHHNEHDEHEHEEDLGHHDEHEEHHESLGEIEEDDRVSFESKPTITTTFYPLQEITQAIVKDRANVDVIVDLGVDPHSFEPTPKQLVGLSNSQLYIGMGGIFESIEEEVLEANEEILSFDAAHDAITIKPEEHDHHDEHGHESHEEEEEHEDSHDEH